MVLLVLCRVLLRMLLLVGMLWMLLRMGLVLLVLVGLLMLVSLMLLMLGMRLVMLLRVLLSSRIRGLSGIAGELISTSHIWLIRVGGAGLEDYVSLPWRQFGVAEGDKRRISCQHGWMSCRYDGVG